MPSGTQGLNPKFFLLCVTHFNQGVVIGKKESPPASPNKCGGDVKLQWKCVGLCNTVVYACQIVAQERLLCIGHTRGNGSLPPYPIADVA